MSKNNSSTEHISTLSELDIEHIDTLLKAHYKITKEIFSSSNEFDLGKFSYDVKHYLQTNPTNKFLISCVLSIFSIVRPKQQELLTKIENKISITRAPIEDIFEDIFNNKLPYIFQMDITQSPIIEFIKNDEFENLQEFISNKADFDFTQNFQIKDKNVNLVDIATYYGSIECFKYLVLNNAPFSEYICPFSICGGNYEIIHYLENNYTGQNFVEEICITMSIAYHQYELTDWLILNYDAKLTDIESSIYSFNFPVFSLITINTKQPDHAIFSSCHSGNLPVVKYLCEVAKVNTEATAEIGCTAFHYACHGGHLPIVKYLCEVAKVNIEAKDENGWTAFHSACSGFTEGNLPTVKYLCEVAQVNPEVTNKYGWTALHNTCTSCGPYTLPIVQYLCEVAKVNTEAKNANGSIPLHTICMSCGPYTLPVLKYLCEVAKVNTEATDLGGSTPLHYACSWNNLPMVQYLCEVAKVNIEATTNSGRTALHFACKNGHLPIVKYLCEVAKVNTEATDESGSTPLHEACLSYKQDSLPTIQYLCEVVKVNTKATDKHGRTALHCACLYTHLPIVQYLCEVVKINTEATDKDGKTALHIACASLGRYTLPIVQYLCEVAKVNTEGAYEAAKSSPQVRQYFESIEDHK